MEDSRRASVPLWAREGETNQADALAYNVVVIGAGWSGLAAARTFLRVQPQAKLLIVDRESSIGGTWSESRLYPHLRAESHLHGNFHFADLKMGPDHITPDGWITGRAVHHYLTTYAKTFGLDKRMWLSAVVENAEKLANNNGWRLTVQRDSTSITIGCEKLIIATGLTSCPNIPRIPMSNQNNMVFHSRDLGDPRTVDRLSDGEVRNVTVYGGAKSAFDTVYFLLKAGKHVNWIIRPDGGGPSIMAPRFMLGLFDSLSSSSTRFFGAFSPNPFNYTKGLASRLHGPDRWPWSEQLVMTYWYIINWITQRDARYDSSPNGRNLRPAMGSESMLWSPATLGVMTHPDLWDFIHKGEQVTVYRRHVKSLSQRAVQLDDGMSLDSDAFIFATGWRADHDIFGNEQCERLGLPFNPFGVSEKRLDSRNELRLAAEKEVLRILPMLARSPKSSHSEDENEYHLYRMLVPACAEPEDRSIAFIGFLRNTGMPIVLQAQALWITAYLLDRLEIPSIESREKEAALTSCWARKRYVCGRKVPFALVDWFSYIDLLYEDLGIRSQRKGNRILENFAVYRAEDYSCVVDEWLAKGGY